MTIFHPTRRAAIAATLGAGLAAALPPTRATADDATETTAAIETNAGKVRGKREKGIAVFRGIPYGSDTGTHRFQPARAPQSWTGIRDCFDYGPFSPQGGRAPTGGSAEPATEAAKAIASISAIRITPVQSEACLVLDVYTPEASPRRKRPVMVWLHGGGFTSGAGGLPNYDGKNLARAGDVVLVTLNHRIGPVGYLYLGALHDDFADSGNVGQLDIILALQWVRDNIAAFGGDPRNVFIFGESGGGSKVSMLLASPAAKGLFHKAAIQSGPGLRMTDLADAAELADRTLTALGVSKTDVHKLQTMDVAAVIKAASSVRMPPGRRGLAPVVDGRTLPAHPFHPTATEISRDIPLIIGTNKDEQTLFMGPEPTFGSITIEEARKRFDGQLGDNSAAAFDLYRAARPDDPPTYWVVSMITDSGTWMNSVRLAERKAAQVAAPVFMYRLDWELPAANGALRTPHGLDIPLILGNVEEGGWASVMGTGPEKRKVSEAMAQAWINFARSGVPSDRGRNWPRYDAKTRSTMIFNVNSKVVADPDRGKREFWERMA